MITLIEDLHWMDDASGEFLEHVVDAQGESQNLLLLNFRPEYHARWMQKSWYRQIPLAPLGREAVAEMLRDRLGDDLAPGRHTIRIRTNGMRAYARFFSHDIAPVHRDNAWQWRLVTMATGNDGGT